MCLRVKFKELGLSPVCPMLTGLPLVQLIIVLTWIPSITLVAIEVVDVKPINKQLELGRNNINKLYSAILLNPAKINFNCMFLSFHVRMSE